VRVGVTALPQLANGRDAQPRFFAAFADGTRYSFFVRQTASAGKFGPTCERLIGAARADEVTAVVLNDGDRHALAGVVGGRHSLPCISVGGAPMM
jgi:hypothetical protein